LKRENLPPNKNCGKEVVEVCLIVAVNVGGQPALSSEEHKPNFPGRRIENYCNWHLPFMHDRKEFEVQAIILLLQIF